ncbi:translocation/assembly module TamB domain-containing protein [Cronbergia sp. UHCC 0137]|uniref:translocation/assembly module TamB domain-containing protein n=1 Tax=Cronbergia sp. UHCC 0137 TaxID=3110239 RepID=UPI002B1F168D|nr:translocation/assembly module TamB domain-containing protein [Cronbergia sp. UHCC 0137]MEA5619149.1 translocation/assembly module TamB domain-containing protein [Cronbergia sp. UHCC 0137]
MSNSSSQDCSSPTPKHQRLWLMIFSRGGMTFAGLLLLIIIGVAWRLGNFIQQELAPLAQENLTTTINRPVKLGKIKDFSLTGVSFEASAIPATATDPDSVTIDAVEVGFDFWQLIVNRNLKLDVTLINPNLYVEQDQQGRWINTTIAPPGEQGLIKTDLDKLRFRNAKVVLLAQKKLVGKQRISPVPVTFSGVNGTAKLLGNNGQIRLELAGAADSGGSIYLEGDIRAKDNLTGNLRVKVQDFFAADVTNLIELPLSLQTGRVDGDLKIQLTADQPTLLDGMATVQGVTLKIPGLPQLLSNSQGEIRFQGLGIQLDNMMTSYGKIPLIATGMIDRQKGFKLAGRVNAVSVADAQETLKVKLPVTVSGVAKADLQIVGSLEEPVLLGTASTVKTARVDKVDFRSFSSKFELATAKSLITFRDIQGQTTDGGQVRGGGTVKLGLVPQLDFNLTAKNILGDAIAQTYNITPPFSIGTVSATALVSGGGNKIETLVKWQAPQAKYAATGETIVNPDLSLSFRNVVANVGGGIVSGDGSYVKQRWQAVASAKGVNLTPFANEQKLENISLVGAKFNGRLQLTGSSEPFKIETIRTEEAGIQIAGGRISISDITLEDQNFTAQLVATNVRLGQILKQSLPILNNPLAGKFQIAGNLQDLNLNGLSGSGEARLDVGNGGVKLSNIQLADGRYQAQLGVNNLPLQRLADVPPELRGLLAGQFKVAGTVESFAPQTIQARGQGFLNLPSGKITASNIQLANGRYQGLVSASDLQLSRLNQQLSGRGDGELQVVGRVESAKLADVRAAGLVRIRGLKELNSPLNAALAWDGQKMTIAQARSNNLNASGYILANAQKPGIPEITQLNLNIQAQNYDLQKLPVKIPNLSTVKGKADFQGQLTGNLNRPNIRGVLSLRNLALQEFAFEPMLTGNVNVVQGRGVNVDLAGKKDRLALNLNIKNRPNSFLVKWKEAFATGEAVGNDWGLKVEKFPLKAFNLTVPGQTVVGNGAIGGLLTGDLQFNQQTNAAKGNIAIAQPQFSRIKGDRFSTQFTYNNDTAELTNSEFITGNSRYTFETTVQKISKVPEIRAKINIQQGDVQDVLIAAQIFQIQDLQRGLTPRTYGTSSDLSIKSQGLPNQPLINQIQRLYEIDALLATAEQKRLESTPIPELQDLKGIFDGEIVINTATRDGLAFKFNLEGQNFIWGREDEPNRFYRADKVIARGGVRKGIWRLQPLRIESNKQLIAFKGNIGGDEQSGQLEVKNFPVDILNNFVKLPVGITGNLNANAALAGNIANPQARGELTITEGTLNKSKIESANAGFSYANGRLNFGSNVIATGTEPVTVTGSIPYKLPFASVEPDNNQINLDVKVKNEGLALLNLLTNQIAFENGQGVLDITVRGTRKQPLVNGIASLDNASFSAQALPGKLTNISGKAQFDFDRVLVENLQGKFSNGKVEAAGEIPIFNNQQINIENPLTVNLEKLALNLKSLYQGNASGKLKITGSVLNPLIGGQIELSNGQVILAQSELSSKGNSNFKPSKVTTNNQNTTDVGGVTKLKNLELNLGKNVQITQLPVLRFLATGDLIVNGLLSDPIPEGTIKLTQGGVNLFTTQLKLARGYEHTATFRTGQPRDPDLNIRLSAKVLDVIQNIDLGRQTSTGLAALEGVRIEASIKGAASKIDENLQLKSSPTRSQTEIVTLLGGGFAPGEGGGDSTLGLINIAGSAVFNNFQGAFNQIGNAFGLSELRLFPTIISDRPESGRNNSTLELALEAGVDISTKFSISTIKILTANDPFQLGINYRLNEEFRLRTSTNFTDDSRAVFEFERRF